MKLNARQIEVSKPRDKAYKLSDGGGLYLLVNPNGSKYWRLKYRIAGKEKLLAVGVYPAVSLANARKKKDEAREIIAAVGDPNETKKNERAELKATIENTFESVAREWHDYKRPNRTEGYANDLLEGIQKDIFPHIGQRPVAEIKPLEMLDTLRKIEAKGVLEKLKKIRQACNQIFRYAIVTGRAENNPASELVGVLAASKQKHFPYLLASELPPFLRLLSGYQGSKLTMLATRLLMLTGVRTIELRAAEWKEFDLVNANVEVRITDNLLGSSIVIPGKSNTFKQIASGMAESLGYKPTSFITVSNDMEELISRRI